VCVLRDVTYERKRQGSKTDSVDRCTDRKRPVVVWRPGHVRSYVVTSSKAVWFPSCGEGREWRLKSVCLVVWGGWGWKGCCRRDYRHVHVGLIGQGLGTYTHAVVCNRNRNSNTILPLLLLVSHRHMQGAATLTRLRHTARNLSIESFCSNSLLLPRTTYAPH
jgi:hypothetical protein